MSSLTKRCLAALVFVPAILVPVFMGGEILLMLLVVMAGISAFEWLRLVETNVEDKLYQGIYLAMGYSIVLLLVCTQAGLKPGIGVALVGMIGLFFYGQMFAVRTNMIFLALGLSYISFALAFFALVRMTMDGPLYSALFLVFVVWASDVGAYTAGKLIGGPKLAPKISPNKTWAGLLGGMAAAAAVAYGFTWFAMHHGDDYITLINRSTYLPLLFTEGLCRVAIYGAIMAVIGQIGDLGISKIKRHYGVKDTSGLIPGHGGLLDRIDAFLLVSVVFALGLRALLKIKFGV